MSAPSSSGLSSRFQHPAWALVPFFCSFLGLLAYAYPGSVYELDNTIYGVFPDVVLAVLILAAPVLISALLFMMVFRRPSWLTWPLVLLAFLPSFPLLAGYSTVCFPPPDFDYRRHELIQYSQTSIAVLVSLPCVLLAFYQARDFLGSFRRELFLALLCAFLSFVFLAVPYIMAQNDGVSFDFVAIGCGALVVLLGASFAVNLPAKTLLHYAGKSFLTLAIAITLIISAFMAGVAVVSVFTSLLRLSLIY